MGGKSRKSGEISKKLIDRLKKGNAFKAASCDTKKKGGKSPLPTLLEEEKADA